MTSTAPSDHLTHIRHPGHLRTNRVRGLSMVCSYPVELVLPQRKSMWNTAALCQAETLEQASA